MLSPSEQIMAASMETIPAQDKLGRSLVVRRLTALDRLRLFKVLGPVLSQNSSYLGMVTLAASIVAIDGVPVPAPGTEAQLESIIGRLGDSGIAAVARALSVENPEVHEGSEVGN